MNPSLVATNLGRDYATPHGLVTVLDGVSLSMEAGETLAIVGPSGSGKSTLLGLLAGLDRPSRGYVAIAGRDLAAMDDAEASTYRGRHCGFVFQSHRLLPALTAQENVQVPLDLARATDAAPRARAWLERVGLGGRHDHRPRQLSGGEQQRVAVARALVHAPATVFADEPTGSLDRRTGTAVADLLFALAADHRTTLVLVTHDEALAERCARVVRMQDGRIA
jgi:putative ABC transport system ATP-binding protein